MPAFPLFNLIAPTTQSNTGQGGSSPLNGYSQGKGPVSNQLNDSEMSESGLNFWQQLQAATESVPLPLGQEFAAYLPQQPSMDGSVLTQWTVPEESMASPLTKGMITSDQASAMPLYSQMWSQPEEVGAPEGFEFLETVRNAQPHIQPQGIPVDTQNLQETLNTSTLDDSTLVVKNLSPSELSQIGDLTQGINLSDEIDPGITQETVPLMNQVATLKRDHPTTGVAPLAPQTQTEAQAVGYGSALSRPGNIKLDELGMEPVEQESWLDGELKLDPKSMHGTPMTIKSQSEMAHVSSSFQDANFTQEVKIQASEVAGFQLKDPSVNQKSIALEQPQSANNTAQNLEKASAFNKVEVPPSHPQWNDQVAKRISIMASEGIQTARIQLDPPELGALEVKVKVQHDQVSVQFASNHQVVRDALEAQSPRLRELLEQQGVNLADVNVSEHGSGQQEQTAQGGFTGDQEGEFFGGDELVDAAEKISSESNSMVDYFA